MASGWCSGSAARRLDAVPVLAITLFWATFQVSAANGTRTSADPAAAPPPVRVVFGGDAAYPPFDFIDRSGKPAGFDVDLFRAVAAHAGLRVDYRLGQWDAVVAGLASGTIDVVPLIVTEERSRRFHFSQPFLHRHHLVFGREGADFVNDLDALAGRRVAAQSAGMAWEELQRLPRVRVVPVDVEGDALLAVRQRRADYALVPMIIGYEAQQRLKLDDVVPLSPPLLGRDYAFAVGPGREHLLPRINAGLQAASRSGERNRIYLRWLGHPGNDRVYRSGLMTGIWIALPLLAIAIVMMVWWRRARQRAVVEASSRASAEARARHLVQHDPVTSLANRGTLRRMLEPMLAPGRPLAVIQVDLLDIGTVEAIAGHAFVAQLLLVIGQRLRQAAAHALVAKVGDSAFMIVRQDIASEAEAREAMQAITALVGARGEVFGVPVEQSCCAGAALHPLHGTDADALMRAAGVACAAARGQPGSCVVYSPALAPDPRNLTLLADLRMAIRQGTLTFVLQPKLDLRARRASGAEMLVRWDHPRHGTLAPGIFVPLAERNGLIGEMTLFMVRQGVALCRGWRRRGLEACVSINVSVNDLSDSHVVGCIIDLSAGVAECLMLEITETAVMRDPVAALAAVQRLRARGIRISLDDFGTGNASLTYLRQLAPDEVKIDRSFIAGIFASDADQSIVRSTIGLVHDVGAVVTAEGVEDGRTLEWLASAGCDYAQGFHIARPMPPAEFGDMLDTEDARGRLWAGSTWGKAG